MRTLSTNDVRQRESSISHIRVHLRFGRHKRAQVQSSLAGFLDTIMLSVQHVSLTYREHGCSCPEFQARKSYQYEYSLRLFFLRHLVTGTSSVEMLDPSPIIVLDVQDPSVGWRFQANTSTGDLRNVSRVQSALLPRAEPLECRNIVFTLPTRDIRKSNA